MTDAGQASSRQNALKIGLYAQTLRVLAPTQAAKAQSRRTLEDVRAKYSDGTPVTEGIPQNLVRDFEAVNRYQRHRDALLHAGDSADQEDELAEAVALYTATDTVLDLARALQRTLCHGVELERLDEAEARLREVVEWLSHEPQEGGRGV